MASVESFGVPARKAHRKLEQDARVSALRKSSKRNTAQAAAHTNPDKPLTGQQKQFIKYHAEGDTILNAAQRAGFATPKYGYTILQKANARAYLKKMQAAYAEAAQITRKDVMEMLKESYEMAKLMSEPKKVQLDLTVNGATRFEQLTDAQLFAMIEQAAAEAAQAEQTEQTEQTELLGVSASADEEEDEG